jgi:hypothetical protein
MKRSNRYKKAMLKAIDRARQVSNGIDTKLLTKANGLRVIRRFEDVNSIDFDPFDSTHLRMITGMARHERFFRKAGYICRVA